MGNTKTTHEKGINTQACAFSPEYFYLHAFDLLDVPAANVESAHTRHDVLEYSVEIIEPIYVPVFDVRSGDDGRSTPSLDRDPELFR